MYYVHGVKKYNLYILALKNLSQGKQDYDK